MMCPLNRVLLWLLIGITLGSCGGSTTSKDLVFFENWTKGDTVITPSKGLAHLERHASEDMLLGRITFWHKGVEHVLTGWTDEHYASIDGGIYMLELDSLGAIYRHSTTWKAFTVVTSNSDSLNNLIQIALGAAMRPQPFGIDFRSREGKVPLERFMDLESLEYDLGNAE